jgi:group I intron endonuclease
MKKFNFVYITTNIVDGKQYVGDHSTDDLNCWHTKNYLGSGNYFENARKKYGRKKFKREILEFFPTKQKAFDAQERYIIQYNTLKPHGYNISPKGGHQAKDSISKETRDKMSKSHIGKDYNKNQIPWNKGIPMTEGQKNILKKINKGTPNVNKGKKTGQIPWNKNKTKNPALLDF